MCHNNQFACNYQKYLSFLAYQFMAGFLQESIFNKIGNGSPRKGNLIRQLFGFWP
jgi:hypothetical protein